MFATPHVGEVFVGTVFAAEIDAWKVTFVAEAGRTSAEASRIVGISLFIFVGSCGRVCCPRNDPLEGVPQKETA